jgi:hypothetical protein
MQRKARRRGNAGLPCKPVQRRDAPAKHPSLRVAAKMSVCGVVGLTNGATIGFTLRLASISFWRQRAHVGL